MKPIKASYPSSQRSRSLLPQSPSKLEESKSLFELSEITGNELRLHDGVQDFRKAIRICHESLLKYLNYIKFCYSKWKSNVSHSIDKKIRKNMSSLNQVSSTFLKVLKDYEKQAEASAEPFQKQSIVHPPSQVVQEQPTATDTETKIKLQIRERSYHSWLEEVRGLRSTVKSIEKDAEKYLKHLKNVYVLYLATREFIGDSGAFNSAMELNSRIVISWFEQQMAKKINFHNKTLRDYHYRLIGSSGLQLGCEVGLGNGSILLNSIEINTPKSADQFIESVETLIEDCHSHLNDVLTSLMKNHVTNTEKRINDLLTAITRFYEKSGQSTKAYLKFLPRSIYRNESDNTIGEYRKALEIPQVDLSLMKEENETDDNDINQSNSTSYSTINRTFEIQRTYESNKSTILGRDFQNLLKKTKKHLKTNLKQCSVDATKNRQRIKRVVKDSHTGLTGTLYKAEKSMWDELQTNFDRASMFVRYKVDLDIENGLPKKSLKKYLKEIKIRTNCHFQKAKEVRKLILKFLETTHAEYTAFRKMFISDISSLHHHKVTTCSVILSAYQLEFSTMAEYSHSLLLSIAQEIELKPSLTYAISEFVRGLKWADHNFMKCIADSSMDNFNLLQNCYIIPSTSSAMDGQIQNIGTSFILKAKTVDLHETMQVLNLYFAGFLNSQSIPEDSSEALVELLKNISEESSELTFSNSSSAPVPTDNPNALPLSIHRTYHRKKGETSTDRETQMEEAALIKKMSQASVMLDSSLLVTFENPAGITFGGKNVPREEAGNNDSFVTPTQNIYSQVLIRGNQNNEQFNMSTAFCTKDA